MRTSIAITVLNEEDSIIPLLESLLAQAQKPNEIIIVDGGSTDATASVISNFQFPISNKKINKFVSQREINSRFFKKLGNRAVGRNFGISKAKNEIIAVTDAGCVVDKNWLKEITAPFKNSKVDVVAGFYKGLPKRIFEKCLVPYVLVMPDRVNPKTFLPASRSMAFRKSVWERAGGFPEKYSHNEDYAFARSLKKQGLKFYFAKSAIVYWLPRKNLSQAYNMFYRFAYGDIEAGVIRPKVVLVFLRYSIGFVLLITNFFVFYILFFLYLLWAVIKNYRYVRDYRAIFILPLLQLAADVAVLTGTIKGIISENGIYKRRY